MSSFIFDILKQELGGMVLYKPNRKEFSRYWKLMVMPGEEEKQI